MTDNKRPKVLVVAGLDSGGGAGVTADCITIHDNCAFALPCVSALTAQSLKRISCVKSTDKDTFEKTLDTACSDWDHIDAIKVGLISDNSLLSVFLDYLKGPLLGVPVVWDPVLCGTAGDLNSADIKARLDEILPFVTVFTPNLPEALTLASWTQEDLKQKGAVRLGRFFLDKGAKAVIIKGGHNVLSADAKDVFVSSEFEFTMSFGKVEGEGAHGGGCALSSAIAALIANRFALHDAAVLAKGYVYSGIKHPAIASDGVRPPVGHNGIVSCIDYLPEVKEEGFPENGGPFAPCPMKLGLYPVVDSVEWIDRLTALGVRTIQLRIKDKNDPKLYEKITKAVEICSSRRARLFIDDHYELAIRAHAYGVHLGMEDLRYADIEAIRKAGLRLGVSTHGAYETIKAYQLHPSYIALGHIFETQSKKMPSKPQGCFKLGILQRILNDLVPTVAIGGIKLDNVSDVLSANVGSVALITGITKADDVDAAVKTWLELCKSGGDL
ncbi:MAG: thiamine phosphate synthase [Succinivibrio sp.]